MKTRRARRAAVRAKKPVRKKDPLPASTFGPSWSAMTGRQRELYPRLPQAEFDALWGYVPTDETDNTND